MKVRNYRLFRSILIFLMDCKGYCKNSLVKNADVLILCQSLPRVPHIPTAYQQMGYHLFEAFQVHISTDRKRRASPGGRLPQRKLFVLSPPSLSLLHHLVSRTERSTLIDTLSPYQICSECKTIFTRVVSILLLVAQL